MSPATTLLAAVSLLPAMTGPVAGDRQREAMTALCSGGAISINNEFSLYVRIFFCTIRFPELTSIDTAKLNGVSFKDLLFRRYRQRTASYTEQMSVQALPAFVTQALKLPKGTVGARLDIVARDTRGDAIYVQYAYIPPNARQLLMS